MRAESPNRVPRVEILPLSASAAHFPSGSVMSGKHVVAFCYCFRSVATLEKNRLVAPRPETFTELFIVACRVSVAPSVQMLCSQSVCGG